MLLSSIPNNSDSGRSSCYPVVWIPVAHSRWVWCRTVLETHWASSSFSNSLCHLEFLKATDDRAVWHGHKAETAGGTSCSQPDRPATHSPLHPSQGPVSPITAALLAPSPRRETSHTPIRFLTICKYWPFESQGLIWMERNMSLGRAIKTNK